MISNAEELKAFHDIVNGENGRTQKLDACATLTADIVLNDGTFAEDGSYTPGPSGADTPTEWTFIGCDYDKAYSGTFNGAGHTVQGVYCNDQIKGRAGLFGYVRGATIKNVKVTGYVKSLGFAGGIAAYIREGTSIADCVNAATAISTCTNQFSVATGGIVGRAEQATQEHPNQITNCINTGIVRGQSSYGGASSGGILGAAANSTIITNCANLGSVSGGDFGSSNRNSTCVGGILGFSAIDITVSDCYNTGAVTSDANSDLRIGGIVGDLWSTSQISNCYNIGNVATSNATTRLGSIAGKSYSSSITNCYYLPSTAGQVCGESDTASTITNTTEKSAFDFANGGNDGVLALLMADRPADAQPWDTTCKYLESAGMTLPVLARQNLTVHDHVWSTSTDTAAKTHTRSCACGVVETEACTITPATCTQNAVCEICKESYGSLDPNNHTDLKHIDAKAATAAEEGNIEYWYCDGCKKYFSDAAAKTEITEAATVTAKLPPKITAGDGAAVTQGEKNELTFTSNASFADFLRVELDGATLEEKNYTKREGSTIITLNRDFAAALSVGEHTLAIVSQHGTATAKFTVNAKPAETATPQPTETTTPQPTAQPQQTAQPQPTVQPTVQPVSPIPRTGDTANPALWFALLIVSGSALAAISVLRRKANRK